MKLFTFLFITIAVPTFFLSCSGEQKDGNKPADTSASSTGKMRSDTAVEQTFAGHSIEYYLAHPQIPVIAKELYSQKVPLAAEERILALMDSVFTANDETAPFYFLMLTKTMEKADGSFTEPLAMMAKEYVETNTAEFVDYFLNEPLLTDQNFEEWARLVAGEIMIEAEYKEIAHLNKVTDRMKNNCMDCTSLQRKKLDEFIVIVKRYIERPQ